MRALARAARVLVVTFLLAPRVSASEWTPDAQRYFQRGVTLLEAESPDYEEAYRNFNLAYERSRDWRVLWSLGQCAEALERDGEAIQAYEEYLARGADALSPEDRGAVERALRALRANVARVIITSAIPDLTLVDSRVGSAAPPQVHRLEGGRIDLGVRAGTHLITATSAGDQLEWHVALAPGVLAQHHFEFVESDRRGSASAQGDVTPLPESSTLRTLAFAAAGVGSAALVGGVVTGLLVLAYEDDARSLCRDGVRGGTECPESARDDFQSARSLATATNALLILGGVLAATGVGTLLLSSDSGRSTASWLRIEPSVGVRSTTLGVSGAF